MLNRRDFIKTVTVAAAGLTLVQAPSIEASPVPLSLPSEFVIPRRRKKRHEGPETDFLKFYAYEWLNRNNNELERDRAIREMTCVVVSLDGEPLIVTTAEFADCELSTVFSSGKLYQLKRGQVRILFKSRYHREEYMKCREREPHLFPEPLTAWNCSTIECLKLRMSLENLYAPSDYIPTTGGWSALSNPNVLCAEF